jgi:hypothetical protein
MTWPLAGLVLRILVYDRKASESNDHSGETLG